MPIIVDPSSLDEKDYADDPRLLALAKRLNRTNRDLSTLTNNNIEPGVHCAFQYNDYTLTIPAVSAPRNPYPFSFEWKMTSRSPLHMWCSHGETINAGEGIKGYPFPDMVFSGGRLIIRGLRCDFDPGKQYYLRFITIGV